jgi:membrane fusion protein (multidrug efflux system)
MRALLLPPIAASLLLLNACSQKPAATAQTQDERPENVRVWEVAPSDLDEWLLVTGRLRADRATDISCEETGVVERLEVDLGAVVREGQVLVELDRRLLDAQRKSAEAAAELKQYDDERNKTLYDENSVSRQEMLRTHTEYEQARQQAEIARLRYERASVTAPFDGVVVDRFVELGQLVAPGQRVARVVDPTVLKMQAYATEAEVARLEVGAPAQIAVTGVEKPVWAKVSWVSVEAEPSSGKFGLEIRVENPDLRLRAGVLASARVLVQRHRQVLAIPRDAVTEGELGTQVFVAQEDRARAQPVTLGADQGAMVIATSGLQPGQQLIVRGQRDVSDGAPVQITERSTRRDGSIDTDPPEVREQGSLVLPSELVRGTGLPEGDEPR